MANTCYTEFTFQGKPEEVIQLYDLVRSVEESSTLLSDVLVKAGLADRIQNADLDKRLECGGLIAYVQPLEDEEKRFLVVTETDWVPMGKMWKAVIDALHLTTVRFAYVAEELGCDIYQVYNPDRLAVSVSDYCVDICLADESEELINRVGADFEGVTYMSGADLRDFLRRLMDTDEEDIDKLIEMKKNFKLSENDYVSIHELTELYELHD